MNRRGFLAGLLGAAAGAAIAPTILVPERTIFLPPAGGWPVDYAAMGARYAKALAESMAETRIGIMGRPEFLALLQGALNDVFTKTYAEAAALERSRLTDPDTWFIQTEPDPQLVTFERRRTGMVSWSDETARRATRWS